MAQEMQYGEPINRDGPQPSYGQYAGNSQYNQSMPGSTITYGQKITGPGASSGPSARSRLLLAIISLLLFTGMFLVMVVLSMSYLYNGASVLALVGLVLFFVLALVINVLFNRKR